MLRKLIFASLAMLPLGTTATTRVALADEPATQLTALLQDEVGNLPEDNMAFFTAAREVSLQLDMLSDLGSTDFSQTVVTVIRPDGEKSNLQPSTDGMVVVEDTQAGPHVVVASGAGAHGTMLYMFQDEADDNVGIGADQPARMTMLRVDEESLRPAIDQVRPYSSQVSSFAASANPRSVFGYRVVLGDDGLLRGRVMTVDSSASTASMNVSIFHQGQLVATTITDGSGRFQIRGVRDGIHGVIASGPAGYSAFAFNAVAPAGLARTSQVATETFVTTVLQNDGTELPVVVVPQQFVPEVVETIEEQNPGIVGPPVNGLPFDGSIVDGFPAGPIDGFPVAPGGGIAPAAGGAAAGPGGFTGGGGGGIGGGGGGIGGFGGVGGLLGIGGLAAGIAAAADDDDIVAPPVASPATP